MKSSSKLLPSLLTLVAVLAGCGGHTTQLPRVEIVDDADRYEFDAVRQEKGGYVLTTGDLFDVNFLFENQLSTRVRVRPDGAVALPIVGDVVVAGRTPAELDSQLTQAYATYYRDPEITVNVVTFAVPKVYVLGQVRGAGEVDLEPGMTMLQAVAVRGGPQPGGNMGSVVLLRRIGDGKAVAQRLDLGRVLKGKSLAADPLLAPYDIIYIPPTFITRVNQFVDRFFARTVAIPMLYLRGWEAFHTDEVYDTFLNRTVDSTSP